MLPTTTNRVQEHTPPEINERIQQGIRDSARRLSCEPEQIAARLEELDREWDIDRTIEARAGGLTFVSTILGLTWKRGFLLVPIVVGSFLLQRALLGWCPPLAILRRQGFRTRSEIESERQALKALRGDYDNLPPVPKCQETEASAAYVQAAQR